jgi:bacterioferritin-associated ferredoxin
VIVCVCNGISDKRIREIVCNGCENIDAFFRECTVADKCKICTKDVKRVFNEALQNK